MFIPIRACYISYLSVSLLLVAVSKYITIVPPTPELDYEEADGDPTGEAAQMAQQTLTYYELDLGLNHVVRKYSEPLEDHANMLISVPGGNEGPSGVLICSENYITYKNFGDQPDIRCPIPR